MPTVPGAAPAILQLLPRLDTGGAERSALEVGRALVGAGARAVIAAAPGRWSARAAASGIELWPWPVGAKDPRLLYAAARLVERLRVDAVDLIHARSRLPAWLGRAVRALLPRTRRPRWVTTVHGLYSINRYSRVMVGGERVICVSRTAFDYVRRHYPEVPEERLRVIPRGVELADYPYRHRPSAEWIARFEAEHPELRGRLMLTLPGRGTRRKGHHDAIRLLARLRSQGLDAALYLPGVVDPKRRPYLDELRRLIAAERLTAHVVLSPPRDDLREVLAHSRLVLQLSTLPESFGRTVIEALALGVPVLGYAHGGVGESLADHYPAGAVPLGDAAALEARARALLGGAHPVPDLHARLPTVTAMQAATLAVYAELLDRPLAAVPGGR